jgi:DNA-binding transcriptional ArsR family regulator
MKSSSDVELERYRIEVDWAPAYELVLSLGAYLGGADQKVMDLGPAWARKVRASLDAKLLELLSRKEVRGAYRDPIGLLVWQCPGERDAASFLHWLCSLSLGDLYERLAPHVPERAPALPRDLTGMRDRAAEVLTLWNDQYFRHLDPAILAGLQADADARQAQIGRLPAVDLLETAANGVRYVPDPSPDLVVLVPQWHFRPWNIFATFRQMHVINYPVDVLPPAPGEPPPGLLRLTHVLGDESRLRILRFVGRTPRTFTELVELTGLSKSTVNHHMMTLRAAGLIRTTVTSHPGRGYKGSTYELRPNALDTLSARLRDYLIQE